MSLESSLPPIPAARSSPEPQQQQPPQNDNATSTANPTPPLSRSNRPSRACTLRAAARLQQYQQQQNQPAEKRRAVAKKEQQQQGDDESSSPQQCSASKIITPLVGPPPPSQLPRWTLRSMWELASVLNFLHVFRPLLNITAEFSAEELETALITPNDTLSDIHIPLLKAIPPITRMALTRDTWVTVLCRKLRDWWHWVADGDLPIVASHGAEVEVYKTLDPGVRVVILKALCDIRVEQEDIRNYIDNSLKHGVQLSTFRKERVGGDSQGISYWYEDDPIIGYRLYREIRKVEVKKAKAKGSQVLPSATYEWETVATNFDEFQDVSEKLFSSKNRTEASLGKKLKGDMLAEIEKVHKRKERLLKKQHRQALLLDNFLTVDGLGPGRSLRDRKPVTYTFDDYDRSINEAIKITKRKQQSPEPLQKREGVVKPEASSNGKWNATPNSYEHVGFSAPSPKSPDYDYDVEEDNKSEQLDRGNRRRQRPQRYSAKEFVEAVSDNEADFDSDDDIVGEAIYDEEYLKKRKERRKFSSSSEGDEEYHFEEENAEEEEEEEEEDSVSASEDSDEPRKVKKLPGRTRRETKLRSVDELQSGLRRSKRATRNRIDYRQYEFSESEPEQSMKPEKSNASDGHYDAGENGDYSMESQDSDGNDEDQEMKVDQAVENYPETTVEKEQIQPPGKSNSPGEDEVEGVQKRRFLDLNELAPGSGFDDGPNTMMKDDTDDL
ncbi:DDT domain-containing protein DDR4 isoform X1 [Prunus yedoensis var. nudiflora]|uniref:DDT domain-containing protein DDR4 isoform X1 n=1 Tax=Prunus yedoensis var. nudiflora TaxID=2094558 RepID=A0A315A2X0_PRUYE|nr:DDT domain-containing protein DDR4 isoform X1 [Prunus yedoensis var. nudiflora]